MTLIRRSRIRKKSKQKISVLQRKLWNLCKEITRKKYGNSCYTCNRSNLEGSNWHTGHMIPKAACGASLKYDLRILRPQCYHCNINLGGNGAEFLKRMLRELGNEQIDLIYSDRNKVISAYEHYENLLIEYKKILENGTYN